MFQTFTGNSRRPRQVNLSGRTNNPFAAVQSSGPSKAPGGGSGAIAHAQLERKARQQERDRLQASKKLQRVWRGHISRTRLRNQYLEILAESERRLSTAEPEQRSYADVWQHLRLCVQAARPAVQGSSDIQSLLLAGQWMCEKEKDVIAACRQDQGSGQAVAPLRALLRLLLHFLNSVLFRSLRAKHASFQGNSEQRVYVKRATVLLAATLHLMSLIPVRSLANLRFELKEIKALDLPGNDVLAIEQYYRILGRASQLQLLPSPDDVPQNGVNHIINRAGSNVPKHQVPDRPQTMVHFIRGLLVAPGGIVEREHAAYEALLTGLLTRPELPAELLTECREILDINLYLTLTRQLLEDKGDGRSWNHVEHQALLANTIHLCNSSQDEATSSQRSGAASTAVGIAGNLGFLSILTRGLQNYDSVNDLDQFMQDQLRRLVRAENISALFNRTDWISTDENQDDDAQILADYILTIIRLLPSQSQADEVRMWIYLSNSQDSKTATGSGKSAIRLFWAAVSQSSVFKRCCSSSREAAELLPDGRRQTSVGSGAYKASDWNIALLFLELYSFALRIQDDEQLVSGLKADVNGLKPGASTLSLEEMKQLVTFLKNISYVIYTERTVSIDDTSTASSRAEHMNGFQGSWVPGEVSNSRPHAPTASSRVSMPQLKGTATALLRSIYERDSRRGILPPRHFIMEELESSTFINDVFREQENRARLEEEDEGSDEDTEMLDTDDRRSADREVMISWHTQQVQRHARRAELHRRQAKKQALQRAAPKVEVLENIPFLVPFETRIQIFRRQVELDMYHRRGGEIDPDRWRIGLAHRFPDAHRELGAHSAEVRRAHVFEDSFKAFYRLGEGLKEPIKISFIGEEGIDGGGVTKEFLTSVIDEVFSVDSPHNLFAENDQHELYPYPSALDEIDVYYRSARKAGQHLDEETIRQTKREKLQFYEFVGRVVGKCLYEGILVHIPLARFFITKWALTGGDGASRNETTFRPSINDLWDYDQDIYRSMLQIKNYPGDVKELGIDFTVTDDVGGGERVERELKAGGSNLAVDNANRLIYIALMTKHYLVDRQGPQTRAFLDGLSAIIKPTWLRMFNEAEIRTLLGGEATPIDVEDLRRNTVYGGVYEIGNDAKEHPTIKMFWEVMHEMRDSDRRKLLQYATSTPNAPLLGFSHLNPRFSIRDSMSDQGRLPTSSTCANLLKLPIYKSKELLRDKVMTAIHSGAGFDLS